MRSGWDFYPGHVKEWQKRTEPLSLERVLIVVLMYIGVLWPAAWLLAGVLYVLVLRAGSDLIGYWFHSRDDDNNSW